MLFGFSELSASSVYPQYLRFRHRVFNEILGYHKTGNPVFSFQAFPDAEPASCMQGVEYDAYDTPKTLHLAYLGAVKAESNPANLFTQTTPEVLGCLRFLPTDGHYMIRDAIEQGHWKNVPLLEPLPTSNHIYEASRIAISPDLDRNNPLRDIVLNNLVYANIDIGVRLGIPHMIGIMYDSVWNSVYRKRGVPIRYLSEPFHVDDGPPIIIGEIQTDIAVQSALRRHYQQQFANDNLSFAEIDDLTLLAHRHHVSQSRKTLVDENYA
jgi:N-acyl-L-homoserine lactone synthetase